MATRQPAGVPRPGGGEEVEVDEAGFETLDDLLAVAEDEQLVGAELQLLVDEQVAEALGEVGGLGVRRAVSGDSDRRDVIAVGYV